MGHIWAQRVGQGVGPNHLEPSPWTFFERWTGMVVPVVVTDGCSRGMGDEGGPDVATISDEGDWVAELACCHNQHVVRSQKGCSAEQIR